MTIFVKSKRYPTRRKGPLEVQMRLFVQDPILALLITHKCFLLHLSQRKELAAIAKRPGVWKCTANVFHPEKYAQTNAIVVIALIVTHSQILWERLRRWLKTNTVSHSARWMEPIENTAIAERPSVKRSTVSVITLVSCALIFANVRIV